MKPRPAPEPAADVAATVQFAQKAVIFGRDRSVLVVARLGADGTFVRWELPGGRVAPGEGLAEGLRREVWEEVGLTVRPGPPVHLWTWMTDNGVQIVAAAQLAYADDTVVSAAHRGPDEGLGEIFWMPLTEIESRPMDADTRAAILQAALAGAG